MTREKVIASDLRILLVCTSRKWASLERRMFADATYLRGIGANLTVLCRRESQLNQELEKEDIHRIYVSTRKFKNFFDISQGFEFKRVLVDHKFDIIHCYNLSAMWSFSYLLKRNHLTSLFFTLNQNINTIYHRVVWRWLLRRVDAIFTMSQETEDFARESFPITRTHVESLGSGIEVKLSEQKTEEVRAIGCVINNLQELGRLKMILKVFRFLKKKRHKTQNSGLSLSIFLGPLIYQNETAKKLLKEIDYEFYEGDILLLSLEAKKAELKKVDIFVGLSFDEPLNDFELMAILAGVPVLFPRSAMRQSLLFKYPHCGESYVDGDIREARTKLDGIIEKINTYRSALARYHSKFEDQHGLDSYSEKLMEQYQKYYARRKRLGSRYSSPD